MHERGSLRNRLDILVCVQNEKDYGVFFIFLLT
jgi:hypothetical protein